MRLRKFNTVLSVVVVILGLYIVLTPFVPVVAYWIRPADNPERAPYAGALAVNTGNRSPKEIPAENRIVIPDIGLDEPILEGSGIDVLKNGGTWRRPNSSMPGEGKNTVIVGHRYFKSRAAPFFHLDKVAPGQKIALYWNGQERLYQVVQTTVVSANSVEIEDSTKEEQLTLYTCTPIWTAVNRLVVVARPLPEESEL